jgi:hypothetical protein
MPKAKESAFAARRFEKRKHFSTDVVTGSIIKRVDEGTKVCSKCEYFKKMEKETTRNTTLPIVRFLVIKLQHYIQWKQDKSYVLRIKI